MGMYTGISINVILRSDLPQQVIELLEEITSNKDVEHRAVAYLNLPNHPFFSCDRWDYVLCCQSGYFLECKERQPEMGQRLVKLENGQWRLSASASLKNYHQEITKFLDWLHPYVDASEYDKEVGWYRYEEYENRTWFSFTEAGVILKEPKNEISF